MLGSDQRGDVAHASNQMNGDLLSGLDERHVDLPLRQPDVVKCGRLDEIRQGRPVE